MRWVDNLHADTGSEYQMFVPGTENNLRARTVFLDGLTQDRVLTSEKVSAVI